jgi:hypothetical protein
MIGSGIKRDNVGRLGGSHVVEEQKVDPGGIA